VQEEGIKRIFNRGRGIIQVGTAGGKGLVMASVIRTLHDYNPTFTFTVIVPTHLIRKTIDEFRDEYGITNISGWGDKLKPDFTKRVVVVGPNALSVADSETIEKIDRNVCMVDECHLVNESSKLGKIIDNYITTPNLVGLTGSLSDKQMDKWRCIGTIGKIVYHVTSEELREKGYKARSRVVAIKFVNHHYRPEFPEPEKDQPSLYLQERDFILKNDARNVMIAKFVKRMCGRNTLIPVDLNEYQEIIVPILENITERPVWVIDGDTPSEERMRIYKTMESVDDVILVAKVGCLREGISINNLHYIAMPWIQKSFIRIVQLLGRAERLKDGGEEALIFDFNDDTTYSTKHFERRCEIYEQEKVPIINQKLDIRTFVDN
jgi:superfamily II DNA or RNA helicase